VNGRRNNAWSRGKGPGKGGNIKKGSGGANVELATRQVQKGEKLNQSQKKTKEFRARTSKKK